VSNQVGCHIPFNEEGIDGVINSIADPITQNLVRLAVSTARMAFIRWEGVASDAFEAQLPMSPFDMTFFAKLMKNLFEKRDLVEKVTKGETIPSATGWDV